MQQRSNRMIQQAQSNALQESARSATEAMVIKRTQRLFDFFECVK